MTPYKQLFHHAPSLGAYGDCWRTVIGCLLDMPPQDVPHFCGEDLDNDQWLIETHKWLLPKGHSLVSIPITGRDDTPVSMEDALDTWAGWNPGTYAIMDGMTKEGIMHSVIVADNKIVHNPSTSEIVGPDDANIFWFHVITCTPVY